MGGLADVLKVGGAVAGGVAGFSTGGPMGAVAGANTGAGLGSTIGGMVDPEKQQGPRQADPEHSTVSAAQGRLPTPTPEVQSPQEAIAQAQVAVQSLPPIQKKEFEAALQAGQNIFKKQQPGGQA